VSGTNVKVDAKDGNSTVTFPENEEAEFRVKRDGNLVAIEVSVFGLMIRFRVRPIDAARLAVAFTSAAEEDGANGCDTCEKTDGAT
jgi:hypothetical protein